MKSPKTHLLLGTRKGLVIYEKEDKDWKYRGIHFLGIPVSIAYVDERNGRWWACLDHGHWGVKLHFSDDKGTAWTEVTAPKYPASEEVKDGVPASTKYLWAMSHGGNDHSNRLWIGTEPGGLFKSDNNGTDFHLIESLWNHPSRKEEWLGGGREFAGIHSVVVDPRDSDHIYVGISCAGVFETKDGGDTWVVRNNGLRADFLPNPFAEVGHDPHLLVTSAANPNVLWQQNHCGIFVSKNGAESWEEVTQKEGPANFGFTIAVSDENPNRAWVVPSISDVTRTSINEALCVCRTDDGGKTWTDFRKGLPQTGTFDIVYRHSLDVADNFVVFGTTCGNLFLSNDYGESWRSLNHYLPMIYSVHFASVE